MSCPSMTAIVVYSLLIYPTVLSICPCPPVHLSTSILSSSDLSIKGKKASFVINSK